MLRYPRFVAVPMACFLALSVLLLVPGQTYAQAASIGQALRQAIAGSGGGWTAVWTAFRAGGAAYTTGALSIAVDPIFWAGVAVIGLGTLGYVLYNNWAAAQGNPAGYPADLWPQGGYTADGSWHMWYGPDAGGYYFKVRYHYPTGEGVSCYSGGTTQPVWDIEASSSVTMSINYGQCPVTAALMTSGGANPVTYYFQAFRGHQGANPYANGWGGQPQASDEADARNKVNALPDPAAPLGRLPNVMDGITTPGGLGAIGITGNPPFPSAALDPPDASNPPGAGDTNPPTIGSGSSIIDWLAQAFRSLIGWLGNLLKAAIEGVVAAVEALPAAIAEAVGDLFVPDEAVQTNIATQMATIRTAMSTRVPFSLLAIDLPAVQGGACPSGQLSITFPNGGAQLAPESVPGFCTVVGMVRGFLLGTMWFGLAMWLRDKVWPQPRI